MSAVDTTYTPGKLSQFKKDIGSRIIHIWLEQRGKPLSVVIDLAAFENFIERHKVKTFDCDLGHFIANVSNFKF